MQRRPCWVEIDTLAFERNYRAMVAACPDSLELLAIVKADAYGHGLAMCAPAAIRAGARWLGVTSVEEGVAARAICPFAETGAEILVVSGAFPGQGAAVVRDRLTAVVWEAWQLVELEAAARLAGCGAQSVAVHLELDTGMSRQGVALADIDDLLGNFPANGLLKLDGIMTHLYAADESNGEATRAQLARLELAVEKVQSAGLRPTWVHVGNSAAVLGGEVPHALQKLCSQWEMKPMLRPGLGLYGLAPQFTPEEPAYVAAMRAQLQPILEWKTRVVSVRTIEAAQVVGYNGTFVATESMRLALLAVGYGDGLKRALSNRGSVLVRGQRAPIVGRISMDQTVVDVTEIAGTTTGDEVVLLGRQGGEFVGAEEQAVLAGTIPWDIFTSIAARVDRRKV